MVQILCSLVANDDAKQRWLRSAGILQVLDRLTLGMQPQDDDTQGVDLYCHNSYIVKGCLSESFNQIPCHTKACCWMSSCQRSRGVGCTGTLESTPGQELTASNTAGGTIDLQMSPSVARQVARLLAILSSDEHALGSFHGSGWQRWLDVSAAAEDCELSSHARRANLNLESAQALANSEVDAVWGLRQPLPAGSGGRLDGHRLIMRDAVHLFSPGARHHHVLATEGTASASHGASCGPKHHSMIDRVTWDRYIMLMVLDQHKAHHMESHPAGERQEITWEQQNSCQCPC